MSTPCHGKCVRLMEPWISSSPSNIFWKQIENDFEDKNQEVLILPGTPGHSFRPQWEYAVNRLRIS
jgi:hypothetical protein